MKKERIVTQYKGRKIIVTYRGPGWTCSYEDRRWVTNLTAQFGTKEEAKEAAEREIDQDEEI